QFERGLGTERVTEMVERACEEPVGADRRVAVDVIEEEMGEANQRLRIRPALRVLTEEGAGDRRIGQADREQRRGSWLVLLGAERLWCAVDDRVRRAEEDLNRVDLLAGQVMDRSEPASALPPLQRAPVHPLVRDGAAATLETRRREHLVDRRYRRADERVTIRIDCFPEQVVERG